MGFTLSPKGEIKPLSRTPEEAVEFLRREKVQFVDLQFTDIPGRLHHVTVPTRTVDLNSFEEGFPKLDGSSIRGFTDIHNSDMLLMPDPSTLAILPWESEDRKTARMICDIHWGYGRGRFPRDPRGIAQRAEEVLRDQGYEYSLWGPEIEFFVFDEAHWDTHSPERGTGYHIGSKEAAWSTSGTNYPIRFKEGYFPVTPHDSLMDFRGRCSQILEGNFGILTDAHHHEVATAGQCEIDLYRDTLVSMADTSMSFKYVVKNVAAQQGMIATFMPKPLFGDNGSGMHVNTSLWNNGTNLFYDGDDAYAEMSQLGRFFAGGLIAHSRALTAIVCPTTNSYRRLVPGFEAPTYIAWSRSNRSANVRVPTYQRGQRYAGRKRLEFRTPDPACNPYLTFAAVAAAGLDGIKRELDPGIPVDENIYALDAEERRKRNVGDLPGNLVEAIEALEADADFLSPIFTPDVLEKIIDNGIHEHRDVAARPHPQEFQLYFDI
jgi:glutamine synthetase